METEFADVHGRPPGDKSGAWDDLMAADIQGEIAAGEPRAGGES
jgi:hypothetical protein